MQLLFRGVDVGVVALLQSIDRYSYVYIAIFLILICFPSISKNFDCMIEIFKECVKKEICSPIFLLEKNVRRCGGFVGIYIYSKPCLLLIS